MAVRRKPFPTPVAKRKNHGTSPTAPPHWLLLSDDIKIPLQEAQAALTFAYELFELMAMADRGNDDRPQLSWTTCDYIAARLQEGGRNIREALDRVAAVPGQVLVPDHRFDDKLASYQLWQMRITKGGALDNPKRPER